MDLMRVLVAGLLVGSAAASAWAASPEETERRIQQLEKELQSLREQVQSQSRPAAPAPAPTAPAPPTASPPPTVGQAPETDTYRSSLEGVKLGGYGSVRFEANSLGEARDSFTFRRFVLTADARIADPLRAVVELEFERFTQLEVERQTGAGSANGLSALETVEGSDETEISLEQAWLQYEIEPWLRYRAGMLLVPLGRFNLNHDDNRWNLPRRTLIDRGIPVLPVKAAWPEVGMGFAGDIRTDRAGAFNYHLYVVNGVTLDSEFEKVAQTRAGDTSKLAVEVELEPKRGTANVDLKNAKAVTGRLAWSFLPGQEIGVSFYTGRYTPEFLRAETLVAAGLDALFTIGRLELEGEYLYANWGRVRRVAKSLARIARDKESEAEAGALETEVEFDLARLASEKHGYWLEARYRLFPEWLTRSVPGRRFANPQLIPTVRWEQAWLNDRVTAIEFSGAALTDFRTESRFVDRLTLGLAYRPVPLVVFQLAWERTWTNSGKSLATVTNFLPARAREDTADAFLVGVAFGF
jgi:hypothetical protein